jgi:hypothetical protein
MTKLYIISRETGSYSDYNSTPVFWTDDKAKAEQAVKTLDVKRASILSEADSFARMTLPPGENKFSAFEPIRWQFWKAWHERTRSRCRAYGWRFLLSD